MHAASAALAATAATAAAACMRACVAACVVDTMYHLIYTRRRPRCGESNFRIEIFEKNGCGQKGELGKLLPELVLFFASILLEYLYTKIRFSTPALRALLGLAGQISLY
jgi:hypothetical protein